MWKWGRFVKTFWIESKLVQLELCLQCHCWHIHLKLTWCCHFYVTCDDWYLLRALDASFPLQRPGTTDSVVNTRARLVWPGRCVQTVQVYTHCTCVHRPLWAGGAVWAPQLSKLWSASPGVSPQQSRAPGANIRQIGFFIFDENVFLILFRKYCVGF